MPEGAIAVVDGSPEWWRARGSARLLVVNDWLRRRFAARAGQVVLQTWHGTPLKRLALHRPGFDPRRMAAVVKESRRWNVLLAQNPYAARILGKAYAFLSRPIWVEGYPRNDVLVDRRRRGDTRARSASVPTSACCSTRRRGATTAPRWSTSSIRPPSPPRPTRSCWCAGTRARCCRGGMPTARASSTSPASPTRRSCCSSPTRSSPTTRRSCSTSRVTGKPMYFLVPDIEHYRGELRGFYFDLVAHAPGPGGAHRRTSSSRLCATATRRAHAATLRAVAGEVQRARRRARRGAGRRADPRPGLRRPREP